ncbi:MAG: oxygenase MpaB family protein [Bacteroidia bacterium]
MKYFVDKHSIVRQIWGKSDTILLIFAGASAEFALSKAVDWLYFTGHLPSNPLGRLFSTVSYARTIVFARKQSAESAIDALAGIHKGVEMQRGANIPEWAYRDVLFMLIDYSIRSFEVLERKLKMTEKQEVFNVFYRVGSRMGITGLPETFEQWEKMRQEHLYQNLQHSHYTDDLFNQYRKHLGVVRYNILQQLQSQIVPQKVLELLGYRRFFLLKSLIALYKISRLIHVDWLLKEIILPSPYKNQIKALDSLPP